MAEHQARRATGRLRAETFETLRNAAPLRAAAGEPARNRIHRVKLDLAVRHQPPRLVPPGIDASPPRLNDGRPIAPGAARRAPDVSRQHGRDAEGTGGSEASDKPPDPGCHRPGSGGESTHEVNGHALGQSGRPLPSAAPIPAHATGRVEIVSVSNRQAAIVPAAPDGHRLPIAPTAHTLFDRRVAIAGEERHASRDAKLHTAGP